MTVEETLPHLPDTHGRAILANINQSEAFVLEIESQKQAFEESHTHVGRYAHLYTVNRLAGLAARCGLMTDEDIKAALNWVEAKAKENT